MQEYRYNLGLTFYAVAATHAGKTALKYPSGDVLAYDELNRLSNRIAGYLLSKGVSKDSVVAIFNNKSANAFSVMLACLKIGAIYTNLDTSSPWQRLQKIISTCLPKVICFDLELDLKENVLNHFPSCECVDLYEEDFKNKLYDFTDDNLAESFGVNGNNPAYIMFTSGSTGFPKGAVMSHSNVLNFIQWSKQTFGITADDVLTNANPVYFDNSVFDFYSSLFNGASLVPVDTALLKNSKELVSAINSSNCTIWFSVPSLLVYLLTTRALSTNDFKTVQKISFGGEGFPKNKLKQLYELFGERIVLFNVYGPTECTCICSSYVITEQDFDNVNEMAPLGHIAPNFGYQIIPLNEAYEDKGELALIGPCVGLGYYNDPARTSGSFVQNTKTLFSQIMYKTGDVVEKREDGKLYFKGRVDNQVKHMGYRIELEEVEAAFSTLSYINEAGVVYEKLTPELGQIKAFVSTSGIGDPKLIQNDIKDLLPSYMVPKSIVVLPVLPKNSNGKIDRKQLAQLK